jgi:hypothetical protein
MKSADEPGESNANEKELLIIHSFHTTTAITRNTRKILFNRDIMRDKQTIRIR